ncbi:MAG: ABC transporter ATP-binding protein [Chitinophagales bacterium]
MFDLNPSWPIIIELKNVSQTYDNGKTVIIKDFNFIVRDNPIAGQFVAILGKSGCGKSTILRYISGLQAPTQGEILIDNKPINDNTDRIGMVFQQYSSMPWYTVFENISLPLKFKGTPDKEIKQKVTEMIEFVGLKGHENKYATSPVLSGGQLQRVAIARSLISNPKIVLMDEPFGALDVNTRLQMQDLLLQIWAKYQSTIVFITHDISEAVYLSNDIYIMASNPGRIVEHIEVNLPKARTREVKRDKTYLDLVFQIEDKMMQLK